MIDMLLVKYSAKKPFFPEDYNDIKYIHGADNISTLDKLLARQICNSPCEIDWIYYRKSWCTSTVDCAVRYIYRLLTGKDMLPYKKVKCFNKKQIRELYSCMGDNTVYEINRLHIIVRRMINSDRDTAKLILSMIQ